MDMMPEPQEPLTIRILWELDTANSSSAELASVLGLHWKIVAGTVSNLKKARKVKVIGTAASRTARADLFGITSKGRRYVRKYNRMVLI